MDEIKQELVLLTTRVDILEKEMLPLLRNIDKRTALLENHMSHIVAEAFSKEKRE